MTVQPMSKFTRNIPMKSALCRARIVGRKYNIAERIRKVMISPLSASTQLAATPLLPLHQDTHIIPVLFRASFHHLGAAFT